MEYQTSPSNDPVLVDVLAALQAAEAALATGQGAAAVSQADLAFARVRPRLAFAPDDVARSLGASALILRGNGLRDQGVPSLHAAAIQAYDEAISLLEETPAGADPRWRNDLANAWTNRGIALLGENTPVSLAEAVRSFDQAIELRSAVAASSDAWFRYGLAAGWMNRGDALTRLGSSVNLADAVCAYDQALEVLRGLSLGENPHFHRRLVIACLNRGITLQTQGSAPSLRAAIESFDAAIALLDQPTFQTKMEQGRMLAGAWMNRANALLRGPAPASAVAALAAARKALGLVVDIEAQDLMAAEAGFKSRQIVCQAIAHLLADPEPKGSPLADLITEATDAVDEGLRLARQWEAKGVAQFRSLATDLFRFGSRVYQLHQPHFLTEFLLENLDPEHSPGAWADNQDMHADAMHALWLELGQIQREGFKALNTPRFEHVLDRLRALRLTEARLAALREHHLAVPGSPAAG